MLLLSDFVSLRIFLQREAEAKQEAAIWEKHRQEHSGGL
jgi:hypothetical protein